MMTSRVGSEAGPSRLSLLMEDEEDVIRLDRTDQLFTQAFVQLNELRRSGQLCDVVLITEGRRLSAHKVVLASTIPYFRMMFTNDMLEASLNEIDIHEMDANTMDLMISFAYTGQLKISASTVQSMMMGASFLQLEWVVEECARFLLARIHPSNALPLRSFCAALACSAVVAAADVFIQKHFLTIAATDDYLQLEPEQVCGILECDGLYVDSEEQVFEQAMRWIQADPRRSIYAARVMSCVRLPLLRPSFLADEVAAHQLIRADLACRDLVDEAKDYHLIPERRARMTRFKTRPRCCADVPGLIFAIGGLTSSGDSLSTVEMFDSCTMRWTAVRSMGTLRSRVGVAVEQRKVYAIGGFNGHDRLCVVEVFDYGKNEWRMVAPLQKKRSAMGATFLNGRLYVCGGYDGISSLATVEVYNPERDSWEQGPSMQRQRSAAGIAVLDGCIYVMGGHDGMSIFNSMERYLPETGEWVSMPHMLSKRCRLGATAYQGKIYVCGGYDGSQFLSSVECFDPLTGQWEPCTPMLIKRSRVSLVTNANKLYAVAGYDGISNLSSMEMFDEATQQWHLAPSMSTHEGGVGVGVVPLPPHLLP